MNCDTVFFLIIQNKHVDMKRTVSVLDSFSLREADVQMNISTEHVVSLA